MRCRDGRWCIDDICYGGSPLCGIDPHEEDELDQADEYPDVDDQEDDG